MTLGSSARTRAFPLAWPAWQPPHERGAAVRVAAGTPTAEWADGLLARESGELVLWARSGAQPEAEALQLRERPGVRAVTLVPPRHDPRWVRLGLTIGGDLAGRRCPHTATPACLTSWSTPTTPNGSVRIPHLVTVAQDGQWREAVLWELAPEGDARCWLGGPLPDLDFFERHLPSLLRLRDAARRGRLPARALHAGFAELLDGEDLSIRLVYRHAHRFRTLLGAVG